MGYKSASERRKENGYMLHKMASIEICAGSMDDVKNAVKLVRHLLTNYSHNPLYGNQQ